MRCRLSGGVVALRTPVAPATRRLARCYVPACMAPPQIRARGHWARAAPPLGLRCRAGRTLPPPPIVWQRMPGVRNGRRLRASCSLRGVTRTGYLRAFVKLCLGCVVQATSSQAEFSEFQGARCFVCRFCGAQLPDYPLDSAPYSHCDPRPPHLGAFFADHLARKGNHEQSERKHS